MAGNEKTAPVAPESTTPAVPSTDVVVGAPRHGSVSSAADRMAMLSNGSGIVSTLSGDTLEGRKSTLAAVTNAEPIADHLGETINLVHVVAQSVTIVDDTTGEANDAVRVLLLDADGKAYAAVSEGLLGSLRDIFGIMGQPSTWPEPLAVKVVEKRGRRGFRFMKIELA